MSDIETTIPTRPQRGLRDYAGLVLRGIVMGSSDIVPGVSGATMALILGIYEELIDSIRQVGQPRFLRALLSFRLREALSILNWPFLISVASGILLAILTLSRGLEWLLVNQPVFLWSFFFGLVLASVFTVSQRIKQWNAALVLAMVLGAAGAFVLVGLVPARTPDTYWFLFLSGTLAICAMILPGISGAFILVLLGKYQYVLSAVNNRDVVSLLFVAGGAGIGIVTFAQIIGYLFKRHHDMTVAVLTGLMLGSLRKVWPWKLDVEWLKDAAGNLVRDSAGERIVTVQHNIMPQLTANGAFNTEILIALALALSGLGLVLLLDRVAQIEE